MDWFIIRNDDHLGPFSDEDLESLYSAQEIVDETLVWNDSLKAPVQYGSLTFNEPPPLPLDISLTDNVDKIEQASVEKDIEVKEEIKIEEEEEKKDSFFQQNPKLKIVGFSLTLLILISGAIYFYQNRIFSRPSKMSLRDYERLTRVATGLSLDSEFDFAMAQDRSMIWIATNNPYHGKVAIKLKALKNKFLGEGGVEAFATGNLSNHLIGIENFKFKQGLKLVDGYYEIELYTPSRLEKPIFNFLNGFKTQFQFFQKVLISTMKPEEFEKALATYSSKKKYNETQFWSELKQKYQTLKMITLQIQDGVRDVFDGSGSNVEKINLFETQYKNKYGNFFTNFIITNEKSYENLVQKNFPDKVDIISNYTRLSKLARSIGIESVGVMEKLHQFKDWNNPSAVKGLRKESIERFQKIIDICEHKLGIIQVE